MDTHAPVSGNQRVHSFVGVTKMLLFIIGEHDEAAVQWMTLECRQRGIETLCLAAQDFPRDIMLTALPDHSPLGGTLQTTEGEVALASISAAWHYLPGDVRPDPELDDISQQLVRRESRETLRGLYRALEDRIWVNPPHRERQASRRIFQLRLASQLGLSIPRTLVSNDPSRVRQFAERCGGQVVYKPLSRLVLFDDQGDPNAFGFATLLGKAELDENSDSICLSPCVFQEAIPNKRDITLYVIGEHVWAAEVVPAAGASGAQPALDYRRDGVWAQDYTPIVLPPAIELACKQLTRQLGLRMCNIDLIITPAGEYVFLDANPTDLWAGLEHRAGFPLCAALVDLLSGTTTVADHPYLRDRSTVFRPSAYQGLIAEETV